jgi:hypothetical protein
MELFERARRESTEDRRRTMASDAQRQDEARRTSRMNRLLAAATVALWVFVGTAQTTVRFTDVTREAGVSFHHVNGASPDKHLVETMGSGGLFFDYNNDGWLDVFPR